MKKITKEEIEGYEKLYRVNLINSIKGFGAANLIGSKDEAGKSNVAIFSSVTHLGSSPALFGFIVRPGGVERHTFSNIQATRHFTINHVNHEIVEQSHYTSARMDKDVSEFDICGLTEQYLNEFEAPYVAESKLKMGMSLVEVIDIPMNGTKMVIAALEELYIDDELLESSGHIDLSLAGSIATGGLDSYYSSGKMRRYPYAKKDSIPLFQKGKKRPDQVVYDEESGSYNASLLPYATDQGAPSIIPTDLTHWKKTGASKISHHLKARYDEIKGQFEDMKTLFSWNEMVYQAKFSFEPVMGETYHLYRDKSGDLFLSMIPPHTWKKELIGSFRLNAEQIWERVDDAVSQ